MRTIAIFGAAGRMGQTITKCAVRSGKYKVVAAIEQEGHPAIGRDAGEFCGAGKTGTEITADADRIVTAEVVIDFSIHSAVPSHIQTVLKHRKPFVLGTTGLTAEEESLVKHASSLIPVVYAPNMSLGINLLLALIKRAGRVLGTDYRVEIHETHHVHKKDAPSGTALKLAQKIAEARGRELKDIMVHNPPDSVSSELDSMIVVRSQRIGEVVGDHTVIFENSGERIEFSHHAKTREAFALGALYAAEWVVNQKAGLYDMQDVLGIS